MKIYLIHGWGGSSQGGWFNWLKEKLKGKAEIITWDMPETETPKIEKWVGFLEKNANPDKETYFIGHSVGCQTIMRYLERINKKIKGVVFVAGWFNLKGLEPEEMGIAKPWIETRIDIDKVKSNCNNFLAIFSNDDPYVPLSDAELFKERLNARIVIKKNQEHFNNVTEIKEILEFLR